MKQALLWSLISVVIGAVCSGIGYSISLIMSK